MTLKELSLAASFLLFSGLSVGDQQLCSLDADAPLVDLASLLLRISASMRIQRVAGLL